jgi:YD repeat-containing protein
LNMNLTDPIFEYRTVKNDVSGLEKVIDGTETIYTGDGMLPNKMSKLVVPDNTHPSDLAYMDPLAMISGSGVSSSYFRQQMSYDVYRKGQVHQYTEGELQDTGPNTRSNILLWGYHNQYPIAKVSNAGNIDKSNGTYVDGSGDVAYTSFETSDICNWTYTNAPVIDTSTVSGRMVYPLYGHDILKINATVNGKYIISYWYKVNSAVSVSGGTVTAPVIKARLGLWTLVEQEMSNIIGQVKVSGTGFIDELRFYPKNSQMTTYLYDPLVGLTATFDTNGKPQYYEYDDSQRLRNIRDHNGNIVKAYQYHIPGAAN